MERMPWDAMFTCDVCGEELTEPEDEGNVCYACVDEATEQERLTR